MHPRELPGCLSASSIKVMSCTVVANGRRVAVYVRRSLFRKCSAGLDNGRALQDLLHQAAPRYIKALKRERAEARRARGLSSVEDDRATGQFLPIGN